jgi:sortase A
VAAQVTRVVVPPQARPHRVRWARPVGRVSRPTSAAPTPPAQPSRWRVVGVRAVAVLGLLAIAFVAYATVVSGLQHGRTQDVLYADLRGQLSRGTAPIGAPIAIGAPVAVLDIDKLRLRDVVVEGSDATTLVAGPGHEGGTPLPGQPGTSVVLGRRGTFGAPFRQLDRLRSGDRITVTTGQGRFVYAVDAVWRSDLAHVAPPAATSRLTLVTSDPVLVPGRSLVVSAAITGAPAATTALTPAQVDGSPLTPASGALTGAYLWAQALLILALGATWGWHRFPRAIVWIGGVPLALVIVWNLFENVAPLLPNTL